MDQPSFIDPARLADLPEVPETERAWAAGFFDGEGCCGVYRTKRNPAPTRVQVSIVQTETSTLERFYSATGRRGHLTYIDRANPKWKPVWTLQVTALADVEQVVATVWPYLSEPKREQIRASFETRAASLRTSPDLAIGGQKLTDAQVVQIEGMLADGALFQRQIAALFGVTQTTISGISLGERKTVGQRKRAGRKPKGAAEWPHCPPDPVLESPDFLRRLGGPPLTPDTERAWAAGFFDAEGTTRARIGRNIMVSVAQTETSTLERFSRALGGLGAVYAKNSTQPDHWKPGYHFQISNLADCERAIALLWEFLSQPKRQQAAAAWAQRDAYRKTWPAEFPLPQQRVTDERIAEIRTMTRSGYMTCVEAAAQYGVSVSYASQIKLGARRTEPIE